MRLFEYYIAKIIDRLSLFAYRLKLNKFGKSLNNLHLDIICR